MAKRLYFSGVCLFILIGLQSQVTFQKTYSTSGSFESKGSSAKQTSDGGFVMIGTDSSAVTLQHDFYLVKADANGDTLWTRFYGTANNEYGQAVQQTSDGGYLLAGMTNNAGDWDIYVVKTNSSGDTTWTKAFTGPGDEFSKQMMADM
jgi:hypothetical protein